MRILAFDPGYGITGWGVVDEPPLTAVEYGAIETNARDKHEVRLLEIFHTSRELIARFKPSCIVVETLFVSKNAKTAGGVYESRGVILAACAESGTEVIELGPTTIKKTVTGSGQATKQSVHQMVKRLLGISQNIRPDDTADALAGAIAGILAAKSRMVKQRIRSAK
jgi:crossover junction endodeoxyribonuclease RuvC